MIDNEITNEITNALHDAIANELDKIIIIGIKNGKMHVTAINICNIEMIGVLEVAKMTIYQKELND